MSAHMSPEHKRLLDAVRALYYSAHWSTADLDNIDALALWENVRDAAGFESGHAPAPRQKPKRYDAIKTKGVVR